MRLQLSNRIVFWMSELRPLARLECLRKKHGKLLALVLGSLILTVLLDLPPSKPAAATGSAPVMVTNVPLPVQAPNRNTTPLPVGVANFPSTQNVNGTVSVGNVPTVNIGNTPTVNLATSGTLNVTNPVGNAGPVPLVIQDSENPARTAFDVTGGCSFSGTHGCVIRPLLSVPTGEIAEVESVSGECSIAPGESITDAHIIFAGSNGVSYSFFIPTQFASDPVLGSTGVFTENLRAYAFANDVVGSTINFELGSSGVNSNQCLVAISGHLVKE